MREPERQSTSRRCPATAPTRRSIWPAIYPELLDLVERHNSTIIFVNSRRGAERLALRLNELAAERARRRDEPPLEIARAHHGSLAREERTVVEELLKSGSLPCLVATSSLELGIDMGAVDLVLQVESPKSVTAGPAADRSGGPRRRRGVEGPHLSRSSAPTCSRRRSSSSACAAGEIEHTVVPRNPLDVLAQQVVAIVASADELAGHRAARPRPARIPVRGALARAARRGARHARRPLPVRALRRAAARGSSGTGSRDTVRARRGALGARGHERRHDPRPRPLRRAPPRRPPRRRARRGDGLRGARRADVPARRVDLADRGDHARPRDRHAGAGRSGSGAVLARRRARTTGRARARDRRVRSLGGRSRAG